MGDPSLFRFIDHKALNEHGVGLRDGESLLKRLPANQKCYGPIKSLGAQAISKLHFPWLVSLKFGLPEKWKNSERMFMKGLDELITSFRVLVNGLVDAPNLEELDIDLGLLIKFDQYHSTMDARTTTEIVRLRRRMGSTYELFGNNLAKCTKLKRLKVHNQYFPDAEGAQTHYSVGFLLALIPVLEQGVTTIEEVTLSLGNAPAPDTPNTERYNNAARDLFTAILKLQNVKEINLQFHLASSPLLNTFLQVTEDMRQTMGTLPSSKVIEKFRLTCALHKIPEGMENPLPVPLSLAPMLSLLGNCSNLREFVVLVPEGCWNCRSISELKNLLYAKPKLRRLYLSFHGVRDTSGKSLEYILDYVQERENEEDNIIFVDGLDCSNTRFNEEEILSNYYHVSGGKKCLAYDDDDEGWMFRAEGRIKRFDRKTVDMKVDPLVAAVVAIG